MSVGGCVVSGGAVVTGAVVGDVVSGAVDAGGDVAGAVAGTVVAKLVDVPDTWADVDADDDVSSESPPQAARATRTVNPAVTAPNRFGSMVPPRRARPPR